MNVKRARRDLDAMRQRAASLRSSELVSLAERLGRSRFNRGKEPTFVKPGRFPLTIPCHPGTLKRGTAISILQQLEADLDDIETELQETETTPSLLSPLPAARLRRSEAELDEHFPEASEQVDIKN